MWFMDTFFTAEVTSGPVLTSLGQLKVEPELSKMHPTAICRGQLGQNVKVNYNPILDSQRATLLFRLLDKYRVYMSSYMITKKRKIKPRPLQVRLGKVFHSIYVRNGTLVCVLLRISTIVALAVNIRRCLPNA